MPTKLGKGGAGQQNYVPKGNGDASGEYGDNVSGSNVHFESFKKPEKGKNNISIEPNKTKTYSKFNSFDEYCEQTHKGSFGDSLKNEYAGGNVESKELVNKLVNNGFIKINQTKGVPYYLGSVNLNDLSNKKGAFSKKQGETFYHEFWHAFDEYFASGIVDENGKKVLDKLITNDDISELSSKGKGLFNTYMFSRELSTAKITSNGKTLLETLKEEGRKLTSSKGWEQMQKDYQEEIDKAITKKYPDANAISTKVNELEKKANDEARELYPVYDQNGKWQENYYENRNNYLKEHLFTQEYNELKQKQKEINLERSKIASNVVRKGYNVVSDMYGIYKGVSYGFCGGHSGNYGKKNKGAMANEFIAEFGSAYSRNDNEQMEIIKKYFPESAKACQELIGLVLNAAKEF